MGRADSPLRDSVVFVVGARRSGTLWLQRALCTHPDLVAVPSETHLFTHGIAPLAGLFQHASPESLAVASTYMDRDAFLDATRDFVDRVFLDLRARLRPEAQVVVERTPWHATVLPLVGAVYPDARVLHIIRDGRDVARSLVRRPWGPATIAEAGEEWRSTVEAARAAAPALAHYRECRYEDLLTDPVAGIDELLRWLGRDVDAAQREQLRLETDTPVNVFGGERPGSGKWEDLSSTELAAFDDAAGELLADLGYADAPHHGRPRPAAERRPEAAASTATKQGAVRRRLSRALARQPAAARPVQDNQRTFDALLACVDRPSDQALQPLFEPTAQVRVVGPDPWQARGDLALSRLRDRLERDRRRAGRLRFGHVHPLGTTVTGVLAHETTDGGPLHRVLVAELPNGKVAKLTYYEL